MVLSMSSKIFDIVASFALVLFGVLAVIYFFLNNSLGTSEIEVSYLLLKMGCILFINRNFFSSEKKNKFLYLNLPFIVILFAGILVFEIFPGYVSVPLSLLLLLFNYIVFLERKALLGEPKLLLLFNYNFPQGKAQINESKAFYTKLLYIGNLVGFFSLLVTAYFYLYCS